MKGKLVLVRGNSLFGSVLTGQRAEGRNRSWTAARQLPGEEAEAHAYDWLWH